MSLLNNPFELTTVSMRIMPWDIDPYMELNNGRYLTLLDLGRFAHAKRIQLPKILKDNQWGLMVGAVSARYRHRITLFEKVQLHSKINYFDERWFYFHQWFTTIDKNGNERINASFLVRTAITSKNGLVPTDEAIKKMSIDIEKINEINRPSDWVKKWVASDEIHKGIMED